MFNLQLDNVLRFWKDGGVGEKEKWMINKTKVGGAFLRTPEDIELLSAEAKEFINKAFEDILPELAVWDHHCHVAGFGHQDTGCFLNTTMMTPKKAGNPVHKIKYFVFVSATLDHEETATKEKRDQNRFAPEDIKDFDGKYVARLARLVKGIPGPWGKQFLLAMDCWYDPDGTRRMDKTGMYTPNDYIIQLAAEYPDIFTPAVSIHPYRTDALEEMERCYKLGARLIKWLPNSQGIDPSHGKCMPFYDKMAELGMVLLTHTGKEHTVDGGELKQEFGNPLLLRMALDRGVQVIAAHCSSRGEATDLDDMYRKKVPCLDLFFRLMDDPKYDGLLFGDISALTSFKRVGHALPLILNKTEIHHRLLNGSDYPLPAINVIVWTSYLKQKGLITKEERRILKEIYGVNPLLYDFLVKRTVKSKEGNKFPASVFMRNPLLKIYDELPEETVQKFKHRKKKSHHHHHEHHHQRRKSDGELKSPKTEPRHRRHSSVGEKEKDHSHRSRSFPHFHLHAHHRKNKDGRNRAKLSKQKSIQALD